LIQLPPCLARLLLDEQEGLGLVIDEVPQPDRGQFAKGADAQLAASAPEMLSMLEELLGIVDSLRGNERDGARLPLNDLLSLHCVLRDALSVINDMIGRTICSCLSCIILDIDYSVGWEEAGVDTVCFYSKSRQLIRTKENKELIRLEDILDEVLGGCRIETPFGIYVTSQEAEEIKAILRKAANPTG